MWNKFAKILHQPAYKRLGIAIGISALLHTVVFGNFNFSLPYVKKDLHLIEARLQAPEAIAKPTPVPIAKPELRPKETQAKPAFEPETEQANEPVLPASEPVAEIQPSQKVEVEQPAPVEKLEPIPPSEGIPEAELAEEAAPADNGIVINENAYQYVDTEFEVRTAVDGNAQGKATITYEVIENNQYRIKWLTEGAGIMTLLFPDLLQISEGELTKAGLRPNQYLYQFGNKVDKNRAATFDWQAKKVSLNTAKGTKIEDLPDGTQDLLSFMYQFMHVAPLQEMQLPIVNGKKLRIYDYSFEGEQLVSSPLGELKTIHILHGGNDEDKTELWLAIDYQYIPVKIRKIENDGKLVEMLATRITTNRPVINK